MRTIAIFTLSVFGALVAGAVSAETPYPCGQPVGGLGAQACLLPLEFEEFTNDPER